MNITTSITLNMQTPGYVVAYEPQGNKLSRFITATLKNGSASWSVPSGATAMIRVAKPDGTFAVYDKNEKGQTAYSISGSTVTIELVGAALAAAGDALVTVMFLDSTGSNLSPFSFRLIIMPSAVSDDEIASSDYFNIFQETLDRIQQMLTETQAMYGSPLTAATASAMTNTSKIYVYVGAESGYSYGHWYYYNGSAWVDGGIYNSEGINSNWLYEAFFTGTIENTSLAHFTDGADNVPVKALTVAINPVQSGTGDPSPDNVRPITGWTGANVNVAGKNILRITASSVVSNGVNVLINQDGSISLKGTTTLSNWFINLNYVNKSTVSFPKGTWKFTCGSIDSNIGIVVIQDSEQVSYCYGNDFSRVTISPDADNAWCRIQIKGKGTVVDTTVYPMFLNSEETDLAFEPYKGTTYPISFGSAGTVYGGTLDVVSGELTVTKIAVIITGSESELSFEWGGVMLSAPGLIGSNGSNAISECICSHSSLITGLDFYNSATTSAFPVAASISTGPNVRFRNRAVGNSLESYKEYLQAQNTAGTPVTIVGKLATPITYQLTPTEVLTLLGENNIWADTGDIKELVYRADASLYLDNKINATKSIIAGIETSMVATKRYSVGDLLIVGDVLYKVASPIASGATFTPGTNVNATTVAEQLILLANS